MTMKEWLQLATSASVVRRGDIDANRALRMALTTVVPYLVSTLSSVGAIRSKG